MATQANIYGRPSNEYLDDLVWGGKWDQSSGNVTYSFGANSATYYSSILGQYVYNYYWLASEKAAITNALGTISKVANIKFSYTSSTSNANLLYLNVDDSDIGSGTLGISDVPGWYSSSSTLQTIFNNQDDSWLFLNKGGYGFSTIVHEILHSVGLAHPHDTGGSSGVFPGVSGPFDSGNNGLNQQIFTIMSYVDGSYTPGYYTNLNYGYAAGPMALDIAALQYIYGANMSTARGNTTYTLPTANKSGTSWTSIWDAGGIDTIRAGRTQLDVTIDLRQATLKNGDPHAGGYVSSADGIFGGFTIANGAVIEKAYGGGGDDLLNGNNAANLLAGNAGNDTLSGFANSDRLFGGAGADKLYGDRGNDVLGGGNGNDTLLGGIGRDTAVYSTRNDVTVDLSKSTLQNTGMGRDQLKNIENVVSGNGDDLLLGNYKANTLKSGGGDDTLRGFGGNDILRAGNGHDVLAGGRGNDTLMGGAGNDTMEGGLGRDDFVFTKGFGKDRILDFAPGYDDVDLSDHTGVSSYAGIGKTLDSHGNAVAHIGAATITFVGLTWHDLSASDFIF